MARMLQQILSIFRPVAGFFYRSHLLGVRIRDDAHRPRQGQPLRFSYLCDLIAYRVAHAPCRAKAWQNMEAKGN